MAAQEAPDSPHVWLESIHEHITEPSSLQSSRQSAGLSAAESPPHLLRASSHLGAISEAEGTEDVHVEARDAAPDNSAEGQSAGYVSPPSEGYIYGQLPLEEGHHSAKARKNMKALSSEFKIVAAYATDRQLNAAARKPVTSDSTAHDSRYSVAKSPDRGISDRGISDVEHAEKVSLKSSASRGLPQGAVSPFSAHSGSAFAAESEKHQIPGSTSPDSICRSELMRARLVGSGSFGRLRPPSLVNLHAAGDVDDAAAIAVMSGGRSGKVRCKSLLQWIEGPRQSVIKPSRYSKMSRRLNSLSWYR